jgi:integrase
MAGSVHTVTRLIQSGRRYIVRYRRGGRGYRLQHGGSFKLKALAQERERLIGGWLAAGLDPRVELERLGKEPELRSLIEIGRAWLDSRIDLSRQSQRVYGSYLDALESEPLGQIDAASITPADVRSQISLWASAGLAPKSIRERVSVVRQALDFAELELNPARHRSVKLPAGEERELLLPASADFLSILEGIDPKYRLPLAILEQTAMRVGEVVSLERPDVDAPTLRFLIKARNRKGRRGHQRPRWVPVPAWLMEIIATSLPAAGLLFPTITADGLRSAMHDVCKSRGLPHCTPHRLRHRRISLWHFQGIPARELADRAGHSRPSMSLDVYSHVIAPDEVDPDAVARILGGPAVAEKHGRDAQVMHAPPKE